MRTALIALIVCAVMVSAFAMTSVASAAQGGQSSVEHRHVTQKESANGINTVSTFNTDTLHDLYHANKPGVGVINENLK